MESIPFLALAETAIDDDDVKRAQEFLDLYYEWRNIGGDEPTHGDKLAHNLQRKIYDSRT